MVKKEVNVTIKVKNLIGRPWKNAEVTIKNVKVRNLPPLQKITDDSGCVDFSRIQRGRYLVQVKAKNVLVQELYSFEEGSKLEIRLKSIFGWFKKIKAVSDSTLCALCAYEYDGFLDRFKCKYCQSQFCSQHRIPENHECGGRLSSIPAEYRVIYSKTGTRYEKY